FSAQQNQDWDNLLAS
ncbi:hypothetical protein, partial [Pseudomonas plecoglossicida]